MSASPRLPPVYCRLPPSRILSPMHDPYATIARFYDRAVGEGGEDVALYEALARRQAGPVLEVGAGTGRVAVPLAAAGFDVVALEPSAAMRERGGARAADAGVRLTWVAAAIEDACLERRFALVIWALDGFLHLTTRTAQLAALTRMRALLAPGGLLVLDLPTLAAWSDWQPGVRPLELLWSEQDAETGITTSHLSSFRANPAAQTRRMTQIFEEVDAAGGVRRWVAAYELRFVGRFELELLLERAGLRPAGVYGDYELGPLTEESARMIALIERDDEET